MEWPAWEFDASFRARSYAFRVRTNVPGADALFERFLGPFAAEALDEVPTYSLVHEPAARAQYAVYLDEVMIERSHAPVSGLDTIVWDANRKALEAEEDTLALHAGAVSWKERGVILPAPPDHGKSTLTAALVRAGFDYLSDEAALLDPATSLVHPYPRPLWLDRGSIDAIGDLDIDRPPGFRKGRRPQYQVSPGELRPDSLGGPCWVRFIVAPAYRRGAITELQAVSRVEAVLLMARNSFNFARFGGEGLQLLARVAQEAECYRLRLGDLREAVQEIANLAARTPL